MTNHRKYKSYLKASTGVFAIMLMNALAGTAQAQTAPEDDEIIVTGSRIAVDSAITAPSPVQTLTIDSFINSGDINSF